MTDRDTYDLLIIGGGLSGLVLGNLLADSGLNIAVLEKDVQAVHKVCGEYLSNEIKPVLQRLLPGLNWGELPDISRFELQDSRGFRVGCELPLGGFGISRMALESALRQKLEEGPVHLLTEKVESVEGQLGQWKVHTRSGKERSASLIVGAYGKHTSLDQQLRRDFIRKRSGWMGIKMHFYMPGYDQRRVSLHLFPGGYAGLSAVEDGRINLCALYHTDRFRGISGPGAFFSEVLPANPGLAEFLDGAAPLFERPLAISNIHFGRKGLVVRGIPLCGDSAGLIYPLSGNGMAMAVHSAVLMAKLVRAWGAGAIDGDQLALRYTREWNNSFGLRLRAGQIFQFAMLNPALTNMGMRVLQWRPSILPPLIRQTHGTLVNA